MVFLERPCGPTFQSLIQSLLSPVRERPRSLVAELQLDLREGSTIWKAVGPLVQTDSNDNAGSWSSAGELLVMVL